MSLPGFTAEALLHHSNRVNASNHDRIGLSGVHDLLARGNPGIEPAFHPPLSCEREKQLCLQECGVLPSYVCNTFCALNYYKCVNHIP